MRMLNTGDLDHSHYILAIDGPDHSQLYYRHNDNCSKHKKIYGRKIQLDWTLFIASLSDQTKRFIFLPK